MVETRKTRLRLGDLPTGAPTEFTLEPDAAARQALADRLGILGLRKLRFTGALTPEGRSDWRLEARLGATPVQTCVVTLDPVATRIDEDVLRRYTAHPPEVPEGAEVEMPSDDTLEPLPETLDLEQVMAEAVALALPAFPRKPDADLGDAVYAEPGTEPLRDADLKPFAGLQALRDSLDKKDE